MRRDWSVRVATYAEVNRLARGMRAADRREVGALGHTPKQALVAGLKASTMAWTAWFKGSPVTMFGIAPVSVLEGRAAVWMLGTDQVAQGAAPLIRWGPRFIRAMQAEFPVLENAVAADNRLAMRLLVALGFDIEDDVVIVGGVPFRRFSKGSRRV